MPQSPLRLIKRCAEYLPQQGLGRLPPGNCGSIRRRLRSHFRRKKDLWTHFSVFEVWDNVRDEEIVELEGLFRHIYKRDAQANRLNLARGFKKLTPLRDNRLDKWPR